MDFTRLGDSAALSCRRLQRLPNGHFWRMPLSRRDRAGYLVAHQHGFAADLHGRALQHCWQAVALEYSSTDGLRCAGDFDGVADDCRDTEDNFY